MMTLLLKTNDVTGVNTDKLFGAGKLTVPIIGAGGGGGGGGGSHK